MPGSSTSAAKSGASNAPEGFLQHLADTLGDGAGARTFFLTTGHLPFINLPLLHLTLLEATAVSAKKSILSLANPTSVVDPGHNAERDMRAIFNDLGYSLPIPINRLEHHGEETKQLFTYHICPQDWIRHWMESNPELLGGNGNPHENFKAFWEVYRQQHPSHEVYRKHSNNLEMVVPILLHGDEGRAVKRTNYFVTSIESPIGSVLDPGLTCSCNEKLLQRPNIPSYGCDSRVLDENTLKVARAMVTNFKGHSYLSRWLLFGVGGWIYKKHPAIIDKLLLEVAMNLKELFETGVRLSGPNGTTIFAAMVSIKGDMDFHKKVMNLTRSYSNLGTVNLREICHHCLAGGEAHAFEDYSETPSWSSSCYQSRPWVSEPHLARIPFDSSAPEKALQGDLMHIFKLGVGRDIVGGVVIILLRKGFFDVEGMSKDIRCRFERAHSSFKLWCHAEGKSAGLRSFTKSFFNMTSLVSAPWCNSKASDTILLLQWLVFFIRLNLIHPVVHGWEEFLNPMLQLCESGLALRMTHHHPMWLERNCARFFYVSAMTVLRAYSFMGKKAVEIGIRAFIQKPKMHALHHVAFTIKTRLESGATLIASPQIYACDISEDFLGRISRLSRRVGFRLCDLHVCERYFLKVSSLLRQRKMPHKTLRKVRRRRK